MSDKQFEPLDEYLKLPREPQPWVLQNLVPVGGLVNVFGKPKCFALDTPVLTHNRGWQTMGSLVVGDLVYDRQGQPVPVVELSPIYEQHDCYRLTFMDGTSVVCDVEHPWLVSEVGQSHVRPVLVKDMVEKGWLKKSGRYPKYRWRIPLGERLEGIALARPALDPYLLGLWLGDGTACNSQFTTADSALVDAWWVRGWRIEKQPAAPYGYGVKGLAKILSTLGVLNNKHVPVDYLQASIEQRQDLLAGLLDTDGWAGGGVAEFYNTNQQLAEDCAYLARSLGYRVTVTSKIGTLNGQQHKRCWVVKIRAHEQVFRLQRKADRFKLNTERYQPVVNIEKVDSTPVRCATVRSSLSMFRVGVNILPTFNTGKSFIVLDWAFAIACGKATWHGYKIDKPGPVCYLQVDTPREEWARRVQTGLEMYALDQIPLYIADMWQVPQFPVNVLDPNDPITRWLKAEFDRIQPVMVVVDTLREIHGGDEDNSTAMRNVISALVGATRPAALVLVSHARKDQAFGGPIDEDMMDQARGSSYVAGRMDSVVNVTQRLMKYKGRAVGQAQEKLEQDPLTGWIRIKQEDDGSVDEIRLLFRDYPGLSVNQYAQRLAQKMKYSVSTATRRINHYKEENGV